MMEDLTEASLEAALRRIVEESKRTGKPWRIVSTAPQLSRSNEAIEVRVNVNETREIT